MLSQYSQTTFTGAIKKAQKDLLYLLIYAVYGIGS